MMNVMNKKYIALALTLASLGLGSCSKDFLEKEPSQFTTPEIMGRNLAWNANILLGQVAGATQITFSIGQSISGHHDFGQKAVDIQTDLFSGDMEMTANGGYPWFENAANLLGSSSKQSAYTYANWRIYYKVIFTVNAVFDASGSDETPGTLTGKNLFYWGQSKVMRAYAYYNLVNLYAKHYNKGANNVGIPIYRTSKSDVATKPSTVGEVYDFIIKDLQAGREAIEKSGVERQFKSDIDATIATSYLAYAYLQTGKYQEAYTEAKKVIDAGKYPLLPASELTSNGFNNVSHPEFIWAVDITNDNTGSLVTFWGHIDVFELSYAGVGDYKVINGNLYESMPETDLRKQWFDKNTGLPIHKFFSELAPKDPTQRQKMLDTGNIMIWKQWTNDIVYLRSAELYLIAMEAAARKNDDAAARELLKALYAQRTKSADLTAVNAEIDKLSGNELLEKIYYNWRVEMWGEGRALTTMKRFEKSVARSGRSTYYTNETIAYDDPRLVFQYPEREQQNNPNL